MIRRFRKPWATCSYEVENEVGMTGKCKLKAAKLLDIDFIDEDEKKQIATFGYCHGHWDIVKSYYRWNKTIRRQFGEMRGDEDWNRHGG